MQMDYDINNSCKKNIIMLKYKNKRGEEKWNY